MQNSSVEFRHIAYSRETANPYYPYWRVDVEIDRIRHTWEVSAQGVYGAQQAVCRYLQVPFHPA
jgi:hypothetical protein